MTMELGGDLAHERVQTRRWVSIVAFTVPVAAFVLLVAWFARVYIVPPTVDIQSFIKMAAMSPPPAAPAPAVQPRIEPLPPPMANAAPPPVQPPSPQMARAEPPVSLLAPDAERREPAAALPMFATLSAVPPTVNATPSPAFSDPTQDVSATAPAASEPATLEASASIAGPVPLPHARPHGRVALVTGEIPLPRPRPADSTPLPANDLPAVDRHAID